jgi:hypothetical protein
MCLVLRHKVNIEQNLAQLFVPFSIDLTVAPTTPTASMHHLNRDLMPWLQGGSDDCEVVHDLALHMPFEWQGQ